MTDLKPCPFCGSTYLFRGKGVSCNTLRIIRYFRLTFPHGVTRMNCGFHKATIRAWNRRAGEEDKHDNNGPYSPNNCRWASRKEQANNTSRNHVVEWRGEERTIAEWSELTGIQQGTIWKRLFLGWTAEQVFTTKVRGSSISCGGETKTLAEWSRETGLSENTISRRLKRGWPVSQALTQKSQREVL